jgi:SPP1 family predicted phage head-tail adaptor
MIGHLLNRSATVYRPATVTDDVGGQTVTLEAAGAVRVKIGQPSVNERRMADQWTADLTHVVHLHRSADVRRGDQLDAGDGHRLRVLSVVQDSRRSYLRAECEAFQPEGAG